MDTLENLKAQAAKILEDKAHWKSSQDGSYELSLHIAGYHDIMDKIKELENE